MWSRSGSGEGLLDDLRVFALFEHEGGEGVAEVVGSGALGQRGGERFVSTSIENSGLTTYLDQG